VIGSNGIRKEAPAFCFNEALAGSSSFPHAKKEEPRDLLGMGQMGKMEIQYVLRSLRRLTINWANSKKPVSQLEPNQLGMLDLEGTSTVLHWVAITKIV
jgi:hypothetical protein